MPAQQQQRLQNCSLRIVEPLLGHRDHQLDPVELIDLTRSRIIINGNDVAFGMPASEFLDHTFTRYMVGQAGEGLRADDVGSARQNELDHLCGEQPALPHAVAETEDLTGILCQLVDACRRVKAF